MPAAGTGSRRGGAATGRAAADPGRHLAQDSALVTILRGAVEAAAQEDGWGGMSAAGSAAKRQAPIDPRNYGVKNFPALFAATGLFDIVKGEGGRSFVADKGNKDRSRAPRSQLKSEHSS